LLEYNIGYDKLNKFETKHKVILMVSLSHTSSTGVQELFVDMVGNHESDLTLPPFDVSWYSNISIYHQDVYKYSEIGYTGFKKIKPYQNINWGGHITEDEFVEIINAPIETEYLLHRFHIDQLDDKQWVYDLLDNPPSNFIILVPVRHPYLSLLRKYNDNYFDGNVINMLNRLYSSIDGNRVIPVPIDLLSTLPKDILKEELQFFFDYFFGMNYESNLEDKIFYQRLDKQKNKKSELVINDEVWKSSLPIIKLLKQFGINYTDDFINYNKFSFRNLNEK
jgi:hypothetical protein